MQVRKFWVLFILLLIPFLFFLEYRGIIHHNELFAMMYGTRGIDVSHHQGKIDWNQVAQDQDIQFVYIKATEGNDFTDDQFSANWQGAKAHGFRTGAYHYFSMKSSGVEQAQHFIQVVPQEANSLPPVIDVEIGLEYDPVKVRYELHNLAEHLEQHYGKKPILYVTHDRYDSYIKGYFNDYRIWIRDVYLPPTLGEQKWYIWQYSSRGRINGINAYVDLNVVDGQLK